MNQIQAENIGRFAFRMRYGVIGMALLFAFGATLQLFLVGMSTFDSAAHWSDHVTLGRVISPLALLLPLVAWAGKLSRRMIGLSAALAALYLFQVMFTFIGFGPVAALHALNTLPLIGIPVMIGLQTLDLVRQSRTN